MITRMVAMGRHGDCLMLHDEGQNNRRPHFPNWLLCMARLPSRPDLVLLVGMAVHALLYLLHKCSQA